MHRPARLCPRQQSRYRRSWLVHAPLLLLSLTATVAAFRLPAPWPGGMRARGSKAGTDGGLSSRQGQRQRLTVLAAAATAAAAAGDQGSDGGDSGAVTAGAVAPVVASASAASAAPSEAAAKKVPFLKVLWRFTRPHTFIGTALCIPALTLYAAPVGATLLSTQVLASVLWALVPAGLINVYITGLNQVTDVEIDRINKPYLPIAAGQLSKLAATVVVVASLLAGLGLGVVPSPYGSQALLWVLLASAALGTSYSLPPLRLKRYPLLAALCIIAVRGTVINMGFYGHALHAAFGRPEVLGGAGTNAILALLKDTKCLAATGFFAVFGAVIALMKDVPDIKGDELNNIRSFSVRAGAARVFKLAKRLMIALFLGACGTCLAAAQHALAAAGGFAALKAALAQQQPLSGSGLGLLLPFGTAAARAVIAGLALAAARDVQVKAGEVDPQNGKQVYDYYMFLWRLFYLSYLALPLAR